MRLGDAALRPGGEQAVDLVLEVGEELLLLLLELPQRGVGAAHLDVAPQEHHGLVHAVCHLKVGGERGVLVLEAQLPAAVGRGQRGGRGAPVGREAFAHCGVRVRDDAEVLVQLLHLVVGLDHVVLRRRQLLRHLLAASHTQG